MKKEDWYKREFWDISKLISENDSLSLCDFLRIRNFKIQNSSTSTEEEVKKLTKEAFELAGRDEIKAAIEKLYALDGVRVPIASTILAMKFPDKFAIIDINVIRALNKEKEWSKYVLDSNIYEKYILILRDMAKERNIENLRDLEFELFVNGRKKGS